MTVRSCEVNGQPGFQSRQPGRAPGPCHVYTEGDIATQAFALSRAAGDEEAAVAEQAETPTIG